MKVPTMARSCYKKLYDKRENEYLEVIKRYDKNVFGTYFPQMLADLTRLLHRKSQRLSRDNLHGA